MTEKANLQPIEAKIEENVIDHYITRLEEACYLAISKLSPEMSDYLDKGLTNDQFFVLRILSQRGSCTVSELAKEHRVNPAAITAMMDRLSKHDLILRERDTKDRRTVNIRLSDMGRQVFLQSESQRKQIFKQYFSQLEPEEMKALVVVTEKLAKIVLSKEGE
ncbi:MarR family winged helix-turn-helix transcriptional regulator [Desulfosporosinus sp.]|uniref:MarR family winged helix-turn-helix transcriptional regulator n=1 Tax=Desulfosporosinus sp. TaxID=157907 RepID=UPI0025C26045|nr:MarR family transcriptional regulator [Desulfosporosinus sp.]MBC2727560.1 MarR family transcriptional regulator [Desulfosporosinus sp.]